MNSVFRNKIILLFFLGVSFSSRSQVLIDMGEYRNLNYVSSGYNTTFGNYTIGFARREYFKLIKKEIIGILDVSLPVSRNFFTRYFVRKGFQLDIYKKNSFRIPLMFASSTISRHDSIKKFHDITSELTIVPGIYREKFSLALDLRYECIVFRQTKYTDEYKRQHIDQPLPNKWESPLYSIGKIGVYAAWNLKRVAFYLKTGYERNPLLYKDKPPVYAVLGFGFKWGTNPMKNMPLEVEKYK